MLRTKQVIRIQAVVLIAVCLAACSGFVRLLFGGFEPADAGQAAYDWSARDRVLTLTTPNYRLTLEECDFWFFGSATSGGSLNLRFQLEELSPETGGLQVLSASIIPVRVSKHRHVELASEYPLQTREVHDAEYDAFRRARRAEDRVPRNHEFEPVHTAINAREGELATRIPFRPRRVKLTLVLEDTATHETETLTFIVRQRGLRGL